ncbi:hypothetical protein K2X83_01325 [Patescibacteria group bacterium]|nr:hypothetical protein [Patescibacteria group bacterium]
MVKTSAAERTQQLEQAEQAAMIADLASLKIKISRQREAEVKTKVNMGGLKDIHAKLEGWVKNKKARKVFEGRTLTHIFPSPRKGVSVRIREAIPDDEKLPREYKWTIKFDSEAGVPNRPLKNKDEIEGSGTSLEGVRNDLEKILKALQLETNLTSAQLVVGKHRTSYVVSRSSKEKKRTGYKDLQIDLDTFTDVQGSRIDEIYIVEAEDVSNLSESIKMERITALKASLGLSVDPVYAALSMKTLLIKEGVLQERYEVLPAALKKDAA